MAAPAIGFTVALTKDQSNGPATIEFGLIIGHYGNCWNNATNTFIAPITGLYAFHVTFMNNSEKKTTWVKLMHENKEVHRAYVQGDGKYQTSTASAVVIVNKGEHVYARLMAGTIHSDSGYHWTNFVGFLVQKM